MIGASAGLILRYVGLVGRFAGSWLCAALIAACTSRAAPFTSRLRSNCIVIEADPVDDEEVISLMPAIFANCRSSGVATEDAIVSGSAPGSPAPTEITGYSTSGKLDTGSSLYPTAPARMMAIDIRKVATGRLINGAEKCTPPPRSKLFASPGLASLSSVPGSPSSPARAWSVGVLSPARRSGSRAFSLCSSPGRTPSRGVLSPGCGVVSISLPPPVHGPAVRGRHACVRRAHDPPRPCGDTSARCDQRTGKPPAS